MRVAAIADVHCGNHKRFGGPTTAGLNRRCQQVVSALELACRTAAERCDALLICGDLFDGVRPEPQVIAAVMAALQKGPPSIHVIKGNHDSASDERGDHALGPLQEMFEPPTVRVSTFPESTGLIVKVPFRSGAASDWLPGALDSALMCGAAPSKRVLMLHLGIEGRDTPAFLRGARDSISFEVLGDLMGHRDLRVAFCGNWHDARHWVLYYKENDRKVDVFQVGALCPTGFDNPGADYGRMVIWDTETEKHEELRVPGPRFLKLGPDDGNEEALSLIKDGCSVYVSIAPGELGAQTALARLEGLISAGAIDGEVVVDKAQAALCAREAAQAAKGAATLEDSLAGFVSEMQLPDGVSREEVLALSKGYMIHGGR